MSAKKKARFEESSDRNATSSADRTSQVDAETGPEDENAGSQIQSSRMDSFRRVAQRRAEHFARAERDNEVSASSTTPTGRLRKVKPGRIETKSGEDESGDTVAQTSEAWPGPWSTARNILAQRDEVLRAREAAAEQLRNSKNFVDMGEPDTVELDEYDRAIQSLSSWIPANGSKSMKFIPKLSTLCIKVLADNVIHYESLDFIATEFLDRLADQLGKDRRLDLNTCVRLAVAGSTSLYLPDCGAIDEDVLIQSVEAVNGIHRVDLADEVLTTEDANVQPIQRLVLKSCGRCFTDKVAGAIYNHVHNLEELVLTGCYRLSNEGLGKLLESCSTKLQILDISCNSRLNAGGIRSIASLSNLRSLKLDHINQLTDQDLLQFLPLKDAETPKGGALKHLKYFEELSLMGCHEVGDAFLVPFLEEYGVQLTGLAIASYKVADDSIIAIRTHCRALQRLRLVNLAEVTAAALIGLFVLDQAQVRSSSTTKLPTDSLGPLSSVDLQGGVSVFDEAIVQLLSNYGRSLQSLNIHGCNQLTNRTAASIWLHGYHALKTLDISFLRKFSEAAVGKIIDCCGNLELLRIWGCTQITEQLLSGHNNINLQIVGNFSHA